MFSNDIITSSAGLLIHNPYNPINVEITESDVCELLVKYGIPAELARVNNIELYKRAFVHQSYTKRTSTENEQLGIVMADKPDNCLPLKSKSFQNVEFLGDGVLELVAKFYLYQRYPKSQEGFKTDMMQSIVKNEAIGKIAAEIGLNKWMMLSQHAENENLRYDVRKQLGNLFEAFLGAMFLDFNKLSLAIVDDYNGIIKPQNLFIGPGFQIANIWITTVLEQHVDWNMLITTNDNYKKILQETLQKKFGGVTPIYVTIEHNKNTNMYHMGAFLCIGINVNPKYDAIEDIMKKITINVVKTPSCTSLDVLHKHMEDNGGKMLALLGEGIQNIKKNAEQKACFQSLSLFGLN